MSSIYGRNFTVDIFGESHGSAIGCVLGGLPPGFEIDMEKVQAFLDRRRAKGEAWATKRKESDVPKILSGMYNGRTTGTPLCAVFENSDVRSKGLSGGAEQTGARRLCGKREV